MDKEEIEKYVKALEIRRLRQLLARMNTRILRITELTADKDQTLSDEDMKRLRDLYNQLDSLCTEIEYT